MVSLKPHFKTSHKPCASLQNLIAVNDSLVCILGVKVLKIDLNQERRYPQTFKLADISCAILGSDFLLFNGLKVDNSCSRLLESQKCSKSNSHAQTNSNFCTTESVEAKQTSNTQVAKQLIDTKASPYKNSFTISKPQSFQNVKKKT